MSQECGNCRHFTPQRHHNGRINHKHYGRCEYIVVWPKVPMNYDPLPLKPRWSVWMDSNAEDCKCYEDKKP